MNFKYLPYLSNYNFFSNNYNKFCYNCIHFLNKNNIPKCKIFGSINLTTGKIYYDRCNLVRSNPTKCGIKGKFYIKYLPSLK